MASVVQHVVEIRLVTRGPNTVCGGTIAEVRATSQLCQTKDVLFMICKCQCAFQHVHAKRVHFILRMYSCICVHVCVRCLYHSPYPWFV